MQIELTEVVQLPLEAGEEPGMPTYRVTGKLDGKPFVVKSSVEIDGRDIEHEHVSGVDFVDDFDITDTYFVALCQNDTFIELSEAASREFYG